MFGIVFEAQGWEFPVELDEDETTVLALNELRGVGRRDWIGLREFSGNRYPELWKPFEHYFPHGLRNSRGEPVTDLIEECVARDIDQQPCHARWVECPDREHQCFYMDRNNPVWREYLKAVIRIQIDAGVDGIQLDEAELPMGAFQYGACFCKDCMDGFRDHLRGLAGGHASLVDLDGVDLASFHYGEWLLGAWLRLQAGPRVDAAVRRLLPLPVRRDQAVLRRARRLRPRLRPQPGPRGARSRATSSTSTRATWRSPTTSTWSSPRCATRPTASPSGTATSAAFAGDKDVVVVENPYGGVVPELVELLGRGRGHDLFRLSLYEGAAFGANMTVPYGAWMGSTIQDSFHPPHDLSVEIQTFLADHDRLYTKQTWHELAVVYSVESTRELIGKADASDNLTNARDASVRVPYRVATETLSRPRCRSTWCSSRTARPRPTGSSTEALARYRTVVLPDCFALTARQAQALEEALDAGTLLVVTDRFAETLPDRQREALLGAPRRAARRPPTTSAH